LGGSTYSAASQRIAAFAQRLRELGWIDGRTVAVEYRWGEGRSERFTELAAEFVRLKVDVIVTEGPASVVAAKEATSVIPIVFPIAGDPVGSGLVASLARPAIRPRYSICRAAPKRMARRSSPITMMPVARL
jgi:putative ABC transport system substrate-binding protein